MAHGALIGARGNSGTILAQLLRGMAQVLAADSDTPHTDGAGLRLAFRHAADSARQAVAHPVEGTVLSVASAAADAAERTDGGCGAVARAAYEGAREALAATPGQLAVLERAGVVDAGGRGLVAVLGALVETFTGEAPGAVPGRLPRVGHEGSGAFHARVDTGGAERTDGVAAPGAVASVAYGDPRGGSLSFDSGSAARADALAVGAVGPGDVDECADSPPSRAGPPSR